MIEVGNYRYTNQDARNTLIHAGDLFDLLERGNDATTIAAQRAGFTAALAAQLDVAPELDLDEIGQRAAKSFGLPGWGPDTVQTVLVEFHSCWEAAAAALRAGGELPMTATGMVAQLNTSTGGLPKLPRQMIDVTYVGVRGDSQDNRQHHGRPWQALCLWNSEGIDELRTDGHPIFAGAAGENITISGIDWADVRPGTRLSIGDNVIAEIWSYTLPCKRQAGWLADGDFMRLHHDRGNFSRVYARVLQTGRINVGDTVTLEPSASTKARRSQPTAPPVVSSPVPADLAAPGLY